VVVFVGLTFIVPFAEVEVNVPGVMATLVAPVTDQLRTLPVPETTLVGLATNELITGRFAALAETFTVTVAVAEPPPLLAMSV
jgi:hypothetical protein